VWGREFSSAPAAAVVAAAPLTGVVRMRAVQARRSNGHGLYSLGKSGGQVDLLAERVKTAVAHNRSNLVFTQSSSAKYPCAPRNSSSARSFGGAQPPRDRAVPRNAQLVCSGDPQHLYSCEHRRYHDGMRPIDC